jgi:hypothetical protein
MQQPMQHPQGNWGAPQVPAVWQQYQQQQPQPMSGPMAARANVSSLAILAGGTVNQMPQQQNNWGHQQNGSYI